MAGEAQERKGSDLSRAFKEDGARKTHVGGQALIEGIMMRGKYNWALAVREPKGDIYTEEHSLASGEKKNAWMYWPIIRGCRAMVESLLLGYKALSIAAVHAFPEEEGEEAAEGQADGGKPPIIEDSLETRSSQSEALPLTSEAPSKGQETPAEGQDASKEEKGGFGGKEMAVSMVLGLALGIALFIVAPALVTNLVVGEYDSHPIIWNVMDGVLRVGVFVFYLWLVGRMKDMKRMFGYHGAEHKTIHCYEHGLPLTPENARSFPRLHVRCGTAFLIMVMIIAILVYTLIPLNLIITAWGVPEGAPKLILVIVTRIIFMPVIAGISYEITVKWAGSHPDNPLVKIVLWPGMQMQYLTTNEPDDGQLACAIAAMQLVLDREEEMQPSST
ncbi:MAG: DUF1385 domain-containing protein [Eggerthellaceae bacterium]|nr:DUF1385 domain-containing protein [Eggerthellaceae bacterium]